jgi:hypothetical protein
MLAPVALQAAGLQASGLQACAPALSLLPGLLSGRIVLPAGAQTKRTLSHLQTAGTGQSRRWGGGLSREHPGPRPSHGLARASQSIPRLNRSSGLRPVSRRAAVAGASNAAPSRCAAACRILAAATACRLPPHCCSGMRACSNAHGSRIGHVKRCPAPRAPAPPPPNRPGSWRGFAASAAEPARAEEPLRSAKASAIDVARCAWGSACGWC